MPACSSCENYVEHVRQAKGDRAANDARARIASTVLFETKLAATELTKLTPARLEAWRKALRAKPKSGGAGRGELRSDSALNRNMTILRAALNLAYRDGHTTSDFAWRAKLAPIKGADRRRDVYLDRAQRRKLIAAVPSDLAAFLSALSAVPLRPGALAALTVGDFDRRLKVLKVGKDKAGKDRRIKLPDVTSKLFDEAAKDKLPGAVLFSRADGAQWNKDAWKGPIRDAVAAAKLPEGATRYAIRHSVITDLVHGGLDLLTVAQVSGTSVQMIEKFYGHLRSDVASSALAKLAL